MAHVSECVKILSIIFISLLHCERNSPLSPPVSQVQSLPIRDQTAEDLVTCACLSELLLQPPA